jgi:hypothetical protein
MRLRLALLSCVVGSSGYAQSPGTFTAIGNMTIPRYEHTSTLLADGRVLITGGIIYATPLDSLSSAELFDPQTGNFTITGNMTIPRAGHTATLLPNGKVLIAGGSPGYSMPVPVSAEVFDPDLGTFTPTGDMTTPRWFPTATLLNTGKVLIAGGYDPSTSSFWATAELYDPATGTFTATGNMNSEWADTATLLPNGKVLVTKASPDFEIAPGVSQMAELYDPETGEFSITGNMIFWHTGPTATLLLNGEVLIAGGDIGDGDGSSALAEVYDPLTGSFTPLPKMNTVREQNVSSLLPDGTVLVAGGHGGVPVGGGGFDNLSSSELFSSAKPDFSPSGSMTIGRDWLNANLLNDGRVLITGGNEYYVFGAGSRPPSGGTLAEAEIYTPTVLIPAPALFSLSSNGQRQGAIWHAGTGVLASSQNPAGSGDVLSMYTTSLFEGGVIPPRVTIGGQFAEVLFFGDAPGYPGYYQVNLRVPVGVAPGPAVSVRLTYLGRASNEVTIGVR